MFCLLNKTTVQTSCSPLKCRRQCLFVCNWIKLEQQSLYILSSHSSPGTSSVWPFSLQADKRAHHNALERKRRDHIKDSFHGLRDSVPALQGEKVRITEICNTGKNKALWCLGKLGPWCVSSKKKPSKNCVAKGWKTWKKSCSLLV